MTVVAGGGNRYTTVPFRAPGNQMNNPALAAQAQRIFQPFHVMAKPIGALCNLACTYCYYLPKKDLLQQDAMADRIADDLLEEFIRQYIVGQDADVIRFSWHGGEPTLLGLEYFRKIVELQQKHAQWKRIENSLQTNGLLLDDGWCQFFKQHDFLVGLSIDGPRHLHDIFRATRGGEPTFDRVCGAVRLLQQHEVSFNTLTVVNSLTARHPDDVYNFLVEEMGCWRIQWLPCVERKDYRTVAPGRWDTDAMPIMGTEAARPGHPTSVVTNWSVDPDALGDFLCQTFYLWMKNGLGRVLVNWFESLVSQRMGQPPEICTLADACGPSLALEKDGSLYACDHFVYPEYKLGHLRDADCRLGEVAYAPRRQKFGRDKRDTLPDYCLKCKYSFACNGECPKNRFIKTPDGEAGLNYLCSGIKRFLAYAEPSLDQIVDKITNPGRTVGLGADVKD